jgi:hypothetical protein
VTDALRNPPPHKRSPLAAFVNLGPFVAEQRGIPHADLRHIRRDKARQDERRVVGKARHERVRKLDEDGAQNVGDDEAEQTTSVLERTSVVNAIRDTVGPRVALAVRSRGRVDLDRVDNSSESGCSDGQDPRAATEVERSPKPGAWSERR